jgi:hypothetical protein
VQDAAFFRQMHSVCRLTTCRDTLATNLFATLGLDAPFIPCSASVAARHEGALADDSGPILINYMTGGGHYDWGQGVDAGEWERTVRQLIARLKTRHKLVFLCHNEKERELASGLDSSLPAIIPTTPNEYFEKTRGAKLGICNRLHASVGLTGVGIPSVTIGTDTRMNMVEALGIPCHFVKNAHLEVLESDVERLLNDRPSERDRLLSLKQQTFDQYEKAVRKAISDGPVRG